MRWKTQEIIGLFKNEKDWKISVQPQGGDVDTEQIVFCFKTNQAFNLFLRGFTTNGEITSPSDTQVEMLELTDGEDSRGGLNIDDEEFAKMYVKIRGTLRAKGFDVVNSLDEYF